MRRRDGRYISPIRHIVSFTIWYGTAVVAAAWVAQAMKLHQVSQQTGMFVLVCLFLWFHPPSQPHHWIRYGYFHGPLKWPLNVPLYLIGLMPVSATVNYMEWRYRRWLHFRGDAPEIRGTVLALLTCVPGPAFCIVTTWEMWVLPHLRALGR